MWMDQVHVPLSTQEVYAPLSAQEVYSRATASVSGQPPGTGAGFGTRTTAAPVDTATLSVMPASLAALGSVVVGGGWREEERREKRLTASELQQRLLAEVDYLDEMHDAEHELLSMLQVSQTLPPLLFLVQSLSVSVV